MRYLSASAAVLGLAMTFSFTPLGRTARASGDKPVAWSMIDRNSILPLSAVSTNVINATLLRYTTTIVEIDLEYQPSLCIENSPGAWSVTANPTYGKVTFGKETIELPDGECPGILFTFATISYEWTAHNNKTISDTINDTFNATWASPDGDFNIPFTFNINVPVVRPDHETTAFDSFAGPNGLWKQTLVPPSSDPTFDFTGEIVQEMAAGQAGPDMCWFPNSGLKPFEKVTNPPNIFWQVAPGNTYSFDGVGYGNIYVSILKSYNESHRGFEFAVVQGAGMLHVVPRQARGLSGNLEPVMPVLDTLITIEPKERTGGALLEEVLKKVSIATNSRVVIGGVSYNMLHLSKTAIGGSGKSARSILEQWILELGGGLSWELYYTPDYKMYIFNIIQPTPNKGLIFLPRPSPARKP